MAPDSVTGRSGRDRLGVIARDTGAAIDDDESVTATALQPGRDRVPAGARVTPTTFAAWALFTVAMVEVAIAVIGWTATGLGMTAAIEAFVVTNVAMGLAFPLCGVLLAWQRPRNPIGWLFLADGIGHASTAAMVPLLDLGVDSGWSTALLQTMATAATYAWPWSIGLFLPLALLLFPDGRLPGPRWRWLVGALIVTAPLFTVWMGAGAGPFVPGHPETRPALALTSDDPALLGTAIELRNLAMYAAAMVALVLRYRRGGETERRQLLWLLLAVVVVTAVLIPWGVLGLGPVLLLLAFPAIPAAITIAILRHGLLDIRLVASRTVLYVLLTAAAAAMWAGTVALADVVVRDRVRSGASAIATILVALAFHPARVRLQRVVDRAFYGDRADPIRAVSRINERLVNPALGLADVLDVLRDALRLPYAAVRSGSEQLAVSGQTPELLAVVPLFDADGSDSELVVGLRHGQRRLDPADRRVLDVLAAPLAVVLHATAVSAELQRSRERIVTAREEERRRLRRDLHDGLGPVLTGVGFQADAARNLVRSDPDQAVDVLRRLRVETTTAIDDVRRLVDDLRPPVLDQLGLVAALRERAEQLFRNGEPLVGVDAPATLPPLSAAAEVAAYRIATEALTNAIRHAGADRIDVRIEATDSLRIEIRDDGHLARTWRQGVGLRSMRERAAELGGTFRAGPTDHGGLVTVTLPLGAP